MFLRNLWYLAAPAAHLKPGQMARKLILGEPVLLGRAPHGRPFAMFDVCPHRGVPLSAGRMDCSQGVSVECPYHGWRFDAQGRCVEIPALMPDQAADVRKIGVKSYPLVERQGLLWIYMAKDGVETTAPPEPPVIPGIADKQAPNIATVLPLPGPVDQAILGLIDPAHGPFVHKAWFWRAKSRLKDKAKKYGPSPLGFTMLRHPPSGNSLAYKLLGGNLTTEISFTLPGLRIEQVKGDAHVFCNVTMATPVRENETELVNLIYWTMPWLSALKPILLPFVRRFLAQDQTILSAQKDGLPYAGPMLFVQDPDAPSRWYFRLKKEWQEATEESRPFENPLRETTLRWRT